MPSITRRALITRLAAAAGVVSTRGGLGLPAVVHATAGRVVVVGGGFGGATCAKYLRRADARLDVTLIEKNTAFVTCR